MRVISLMNTAFVSIALLAGAAAPGMASAQDYYSRGHQDAAYQGRNSYDSGWRQGDGYHQNRRGGDQGYGYQNRWQGRDFGYRGYARDENDSYDRHAGYRGDWSGRHDDWGYRHHRPHYYRNWNDRTGW